MEMYEFPVLRNEKKIIFVCLCIILSIFALTACDVRKEHQFYGNTMGTTYHIKVVSHGFNNPAHLKNKITRRLEDINRSMSTYMKDSEISSFNQSRDIDTPFAVSSDFFHVMTISQTLYQLTKGAWDGTVKPLIDLWGFTGHTLNPVIPDPSDISQTKAQIGFDKIQLSKDNNLIKKHPLVTVDLASIAKGFGVDEITELIQENGYTDFIVEIGGEVFASGTTKDKTPWKVGINTPDKNAAFNTIYKTVDLDNNAVATSGDYRNFFEVNGKRFSHIIDPRTGYPITSDVASVTIISDTCAFADGLATAIMVMGVKEGLDLINRLDHTEGLIITKNEDGSFSDHPSNGFPD